MLSVGQFLKNNNDILMAFYYDLENKDICKKK